MVRTALKGMLHAKLDALSEAECLLQIKERTGWSELLTRDAVQTPDDSTIRRSVSVDGTK